MSSGASRMMTVHRAPPPPLDDSASSSRTSLFAEVGRSIGEEAADKLVADFGGRRIYIPITPAAGDLVTSSIGLVAATAIARVFGGDRLLIPSTNHQTRRRAQILAMRAERMSISRIAHELRCTERYVYKVLAAERNSIGASGIVPGST